MGLDVHCHKTEAFESSYSMRKPSDVQDDLFFEATGYTLYSDNTFTPVEVKKMYKQLRNRVLEILKYREGVHKLWSNTDEDEVEAAKEAHKAEKKNFVPLPPTPPSTTTTITKVEKGKRSNNTRTITFTLTTTLVETFTSHPISNTVIREEGASKIIRATCSDGLVREFRKRHKKIICDERYDKITTKHKWGVYRNDDVIDDALLMMTESGVHLGRWHGDEEALYWLQKIEDRSNKCHSILAFLRHCAENDLYITTCN